MCTNPRNNDNLAPMQDLGLDLGLQPLERILEIPVFMVYFPDVGEIKYNGDSLVVDTDGVEPNSLEQSTIASPTSVTDYWEYINY